MRLARSPLSLLCGLTTSVVLSIGFAVGQCMGGYCWTILGKANGSLWQEMFFTL
jgi:hypothetical protein